MKRLRDVLRFRLMIAPYVLEILFWAGIGGTLYGTYWLFTHDHWAWWIALLFGSLLTRVIFEFGLLAFRHYDCIVDIRDTLKHAVSAETDSRTPRPRP